MTDPIDDMIRAASAPSPAPPPRRKRTRLALAILLGLAAVLLALPLLLALTGGGLDDLLLWGLATGDPGALILGGD